MMPANFLTYWSFFIGDVLLGVSMQTEQQALYDSYATLAQVACFLCMIVAALHYTRDCQQPQVSCSSF